MATNYSRGRAFEYKVRDHYRNLGFVVIRAAGSKGAIDLVALNREFPPVLIQCKKHGKIPAAEKREFMKQAKIAGGTPILATMKNRKMDLTVLRARHTT